MEIRRAHPDDATAIAEMESNIFGDPWSEKDILSYISSSIGMCFTALENGVPIGYIIGQSILTEAEIYRIAVREDKRRNEVGNRLLTYALDAVHEDGVDTVYLEVRSRNTAAIGFYRSLGFNECGYRDGYYQNPNDDALVMIIRL